MRTMLQDAAKPSEQWTLLRNQYRVHSALAHDTVYAMPILLINIIRKQMPEVLTADDARFERSLRKAANVGFFWKQPIFFLPLADKLPLAPAEKKRQD